MLGAHDYKGLETFGFKFVDEYRGLLASQMREAYEYAKKGAADELRAPSPATPRETALLIAQNARAVADKQMGDLLFIVKAEVLKEWRKSALSESTNLGLSDLLGFLNAAFNDYFKNKIALTGGVIVSQAVNRARDDVFEGMHDRIAVYQYSALLDGSCPICIDLDGMVLNYAQYRATKWIPPIHHWCRCIWVAILNEQAEIPAITGEPKLPGDVSEPFL